MRGVEASMPPSAGSPREAYQWRALTGSSCWASDERKAVRCRTRLPATTLSGKAKFSGTATPLKGGNHLLRAAAHRRKASVPRENGGYPQMAPTNRASAGSSASWRPGHAAAQERLFHCNVCKALTLAVTVASEARLLDLLRDF